MTITNFAALPLKRHNRAARWIVDAVDWVRMELHTARVESQDEQFLATAKGVHYGKLR